MNRKIRSLLAKRFIILKPVVNMTRKEFLSTLGMGAAFALTATCLGACTKESLAPQGNVDFSLDLRDSANAALLQNGGYVVRNGVVVARTLDGRYVAATQVCSHEGNPNVIFRSNEFYCTVHGARYDTTGRGLNSFGARGLTIYQTALENDTLRVFS